MKKLVYLFLTLLIIGCSSDDSDSGDCPGEATLIAQLEDAGTLLEMDPTTENCQSYLDAITLYLDCSQNISTADRIELEATIALIDCDLL